MAKKFADIIASKTKNALGSSLISLEAIKQSIVVLEELRTFIPPLNTDELSQLEQNILTYGCKDALLVWETTQTEVGGNTSEPVFALIDGHNRFSICRKHTLPFNIQLLQFTSLKEVKDYMIDLQLGRRNLNPQQVSYFRGLRYNNEKAEKGKYDRENHKGQNVPYTQNTAQRLAAEYNVNEKTIKRDADYAEGLNKLSDTLRNEVLAGKQNIDKGLIQKLAKVETQASIESAEKIEELLSRGEDKQTIKITEKELKKTFNLLVDSSKKLAQTRDKNHIIEIKNLIKKIESWM
ncbi:hypothetical protein [Emticicia oligotrophica]|uniref:hypothetical protein n=1 Tax=Emticicia oligotrophica TaxID=312279 RepID=UPI00273C903C|nr:hypothetical protein [Emticicia oligotrophica]